MPRDDAALLDIVRAARRCVGISRRLDEAAFLADVDAQGNMLYGLVVLGEAVRRLSDEFQAQHGAIPWREIVGMRNRLVHEYDDVDLHIVWQSVQKDLPLLIQAIEPLLPSKED
jgi:uncharacterized protein with HEPN domain